ncbi:sigma-70 family RNA polymerase sigma factor [Streptomyces sp. NPDC046900]|uniref:sigma-70 family RNA polymerase sigma factor n=1 Tax=Streptomyces sp. NPDC046900 TaxID=3155473 RepID=UPI0033D298CE
MNSPQPLTNRRIPSDDDTHIQILTPRNPDTPNGPHTAAPDPAKLLVRFEREAMPFLDRLYATATHLTHDRVHAEDLVQTTYLRAFDAFGALTAETSLKVWLFQLLADTALHVSGEWRRPQPSNSSTACPCRRSQEEHHPRFCDPQMSQAQALEQLPDREVKAALQQLPQELAIVVYLADAEDFSPTEIADILAIPQVTATSLLLYGRHCLLHALTDAARRHGFLD